MSVLHGCAADDRRDDADQIGTTGPIVEAPHASGKGKCPECNKPFKPVHPRQLFCSPVHKAAFHNRATVRGRMLTPLAIAARITRGGSRVDKGVGSTARRDGERLMDAWAREDRVAGRMSMVAYVRERGRIGY